MIFLQIRPPLWVVECNRVLGGVFESGLDHLINCSTFWLWLSWDHFSHFIQLAAIAKSSLNLCSFNSVQQLVANSLACMVCIWLSTASTIWRCYPGFLLNRKAQTSTSFAVSGLHLYASSSVLTVQRCTVWLLSILHSCVVLRCMYIHRHAHVRKLKLIGMLRPFYMPCTKLTHIVVWTV